MYQYSTTAHTLVLSGVASLDTPFWGIKLSRLLTASLATRFS